MRRLKAKILAAVYICFASIFDVVACGPFFPNWMLTDTDSQMLDAPWASFSRELIRMQPSNPAFTAKPPKYCFCETLETLGAELDDLRAALKMAKMPEGEIDAVVSSHRQEREKIDIYPSENNSCDFELRPSVSAPSRFPGAVPAVSAGLPKEFAYYFRGCIAWHGGDFAGARKIWLELLELPPEERIFKSTWAAYMVAKSFEEDDPKQAIAYFQMVRELVKNGFKDSTGLAAASLGWEARQHKHAGRTLEALKLYLGQWAAGDPYALGSLKFTCQDAFHGNYRSMLRSFASDPLALKVMNAYVISHDPGDIDVDDPLKEAFLNLMEKAAAKYPRVARVLPAHSYRPAIELWLEAVEAADVKDVLAAEQIALAQYRAGKLDAARRWLKLAPSTPTARWLKAKLLLHDGRLDEAAEILSKLSDRFPPAALAENPTPVKRLGLEGSLYLNDGDLLFLKTPFANEVGAELGVLKLAQSQYVESLDLLLKSGSWADAAYVAEDVLSTDELKAYVDKNWPAELLAMPDKDEESVQDDYRYWDSYWVLNTHGACVKIRHLLARRLARYGSLQEARQYYPESLLKVFDSYCANISAATDSGTPKERKAEAYWEAAKIARFNGLELFGTELEPDWFYHDGSYEEGPTFSERKNSGLAPPSADEHERAAKSVPSPNKRLHYRYNAADLAWKAAELMPDNSDMKAVVLCSAGTWLKNRDPEQADKFYKALVRRCRKTEIGEAADKMRWFPVLDENGQIKKKAAAGQ